MLQEVLLIPRVTQIRTARLRFEPNSFDPKVNTWRTDDVGRPVWRRRQSSLEQLDKTCGERLATCKKCHQCRVPLLGSDISGCHQHAHGTYPWQGKIGTKRVSFDGFWSFKYIYFISLWLGTLSDYLELFSIFDHRSNSLAICLILDSSAWLLFTVAWEKSKN